MRIIDADNMTVTHTTPKTAEWLKQQFDRGFVKDCVGDVLAWEDCLDGAGDLCLDEAAFETVEELIGMKNKR